MRNPEGDHAQGGREGLELGDDGAEGVLGLWLGAPAREVDLEVPEVGKGGEGREECGALGVRLVEADILRSMGAYI